MSFSTSSDRSIPIIAAWTVSRCDASTVRWTVDLTFAPPWWPDGLAAERFRVFGPGASAFVAIGFVLRPVAIPPCPARGRVGPADVERYRPTGPGL